MTEWIPEIDTSSPTLLALRDKLIKKRAVAKVNLPALARRDTGLMRCFKADPGEVFVSCDFSSLEPTITAHFSADFYYSFACYGGIGKLPEIDGNGTLLIDDLYLMVASRTPGLDTPVLSFFSSHENKQRWLTDRAGVLAVKEIKVARSKAKPACLGWNYGMGPKRFVKQSYDAGLTVSQEDAKQMFKAYWELFKDVKSLSKKLEVISQKQGFLVNPMGYRLTGEPRKAYNSFIQSTASGVVDLLALIFFPKVPYAKLVAYIHDELIYTIPQEKIEECRLAKEQAVVELNALLGWSVPQRLSWTVARDFSEIK